jgi:hypothetical protein
VSLRKLGGEGERLANVGLFEVRKVSEQLVHSAPSGQCLDDHSDRHPHASDARLSAHHFRIDCDAPQLLHILYRSALPRVPQVVHTPLPFQPVFASSTRPSIPFAKKPSG